MSIFAFLAFFIWTVIGMILFLIIAEETDLEAYKFQKGHFKLYLLSHLFGPAALAACIIYAFVTLVVLFLECNFFDKLIDWINKK